MTEKVHIETPFESSTFNSTGGLKTAITHFRATHPNATVGTVTIRNNTRTWYIVDNKPRFV